MLNSTCVFVCLPEARVIVLPLCLDHVKSCLRAKVQMKLAISLLSDVMDQTFKLKQVSLIVLVVYRHAHF